MSSTDLDPGFVVTHDDPAHATGEFEARTQKMRALIGRVVRVAQQQLAIVVRAYNPDVVNVVSLPGMRPMLSAQGFELVDLRIATVFWRAENGVQYIALVTRIDEGGVHDLLVLSDGYVDLGAGAGVPVARLRVPRGSGRDAWCMELDT